MLARIIFSIPMSSTALAMNRRWSGRYGVSADNRDVTTLDESQEHISLRPPIWLMHPPLIELRIWRAFDLFRG